MKALKMYILGLCLGWACFTCLFLLFGVGTFRAIIAGFLTMLAITFVFESAKI